MLHESCLIKTKTQSNPIFQCLFVCHSQCIVWLHLCMYECVRVCMSGELKMRRRTTRATQRWMIFGLWAEVAVQARAGRVCRQQGYIHWAAYDEGEEQEATATNARQAYNLSTAEQATFMLQNRTITPHNPPRHERTHKVGSYFFTFFFIPTLFFFLQ